jgi:aldehyde dehydrogenase (NAD+)
VAQAQTITQTLPFTRHPYADGGFKKMLIDGKWVAAASGKTFESRNPATGELLATVAEGDAEDINRAVAAARKAFEGPWSKVKPVERQAILLRLADLVAKNFDELSELDTLDMGAPISRTRGTRLRVIGMLRYYAGKATAIVGETIENSLPGEVFSYTLKEPVGVVGAIIPWNGPLGASVWKIGPALATGCTVILKPAEEAPLTSLRLGALCMEAGVPPGVVNVMPGYGETAGAALAAHPGVDKVAFTGSHITGQSIVKASAGNLKRVSLELGGKSPDVVFADADLDAAVPGAAMAVFANSGQICSAGTRLFVESRAYDEFVGKVAAFGKNLRVGNGLDPETQIGPLVSEQQLDRVTGYLAIGAKEGATALTGGARATDGPLAKGYFVPPTVFANVNDNMRIAQEEIFGPVISAISFKDGDDLVGRANSTMFGLGSGVWTRDVSKAHKLAKAIRAGSVWVKLPGDGPGGAVWRLQDERLRPRVRPAASRGVPQRQGGLDQDRLTRAAHDTGGVEPSRRLTRPRARCMHAAAAVDRTAGSTSTTESRNARRPAGCLVRLDARRVARTARYSRARRARRHLLQSGSAGRMDATSRRCRGRAHGAVRDRRHGVQRHPAVLRGTRGIGLGGARLR